MSQTLNLNNFSSLNILARTTLTADLAAGLSSLPVVNSGDLTAGPVLIGSPENQTSELNMATAPSLSTAIPLASPTKLSHNNNDTVLLLLGNYLRVYTAPDLSNGAGTQPPDATFTLLSGGTIAIDGNRTSTPFTDSVSPNGTWYKYTYYNPSNNNETALASSAAVQSGQVHLVGLDQIRRAAGFRSNPKVTDDIISEFRDAAEKEVLGSLAAVYTLPLPQPTNPIVMEIVKNIAAGELMHEEYLEVSPSMAAEGEAKASAARNGGGSHTSLAELVNRDVVLMDANYVEETIDEAHGFGGYPDNTTADTTGIYSNQQLGLTGHDRGFQFWINKEY